MGSMLGTYSYVVKAQIPLDCLHPAQMAEPIRKVLSENLLRLMRTGQSGEVSQAELGRRARVDQRNVGRIVSGDISTTVDTLGKLARAFDLDAWQLLVPGLDPSNPPINHITEDEKRLYERLREAARLVMDTDAPPYRQK